MIIAYTHITTKEIIFCTPRQETAMLKLYKEEGRYFDEYERKELKGPFAISASHTLFFDC